MSEFTGSESEGEVLEQIKSAVRKWYGTLSIKEIVTNTDLISEIEALEKLFSSKEIPA